MFKMFFHCCCCCCCIINRDCCNLQEIFVEHNLLDLSKNQIFPRRARRWDRKACGRWTSCCFISHFHISRTFFGNMSIKTRIAPIPTFFLTKHKYNGTKYVCLYQYTLSLLSLKLSDFNSRASRGKLFVEMVSTFQKKIIT